MNRKLLLTLIVIVAGLMLGFVFSQSFDNNSFKNSSGTKTPPQSQMNTNSSSTQQQTNQDPKDTEFEVDLSVNPPSVKNNPDLGADLKNASRAILGISYTNSSISDLTGIRIELIPSTSIRFKATGSNTAKINKELTVINKNLTFELEDLKPGESKKAILFIYPQQVGKIKLRVVAKTKEGRTNTSHPFTITVE